MFPAPRAAARYLGERGDFAVAGADSPSNPDDVVNPVFKVAAVPFCIVPLARTATGMFLTLGAAARQYGIPKSTLSRALRDGRLTGERSADTGSYRIEVSELERWRDALNVVRATAETVPVAQQATHVATALERVAALEAEIAGLRELVRVHSAASDQWREQAQRLALADQRARSVPAVVQQPRPWWRRLAG